MAFPGFSLPFISAYYLHSNSGCKGVVGEESYAGRKGEDLQVAGVEGAQPQAAGARVRGRGQMAEEAQKLSL